MRSATCWKSRRRLFERPPETLQGTARELIRGAYKLQDRLLLILDTERTVNVTGSGHVQPAEGRVTSETGPHSVQWEVP